MKKLGEGWQYTVYDLENGRVLKKYNTRLRTCWIILKDIIPGEISGILKIPKYIPDLKCKALQSFEILKRTNVPLDWLANPRFVNEFDYEQDKVTPLINIFEQSSFEESKKIIDQFIEFNHKLIEHRLIDKFFNISKNFGLNSQGNIVLTDIGELLDNREKIYQQCKNRVWIVPYKLKWLRNVELRTYFVEQMDKHFVESR